VEFKLESLNVSYKALVLLLEGQIREASNEKIIRMRKSQLNNKENDYARRCQKLEIAIEKVDIIAQPVAYGIIKVENE
jgi:hypothetical protein